MIVKTYETRCPRCKTDFSMDGDVTEHYIIAGRGNGREYILEHCPICDNRFYILNVDPELYNARIRGVCKEYTRDRLLSKLHEFKAPLSIMEEHMLSEVEFVYNVPLNDFYILADEVTATRCDR